MNACEQLIEALEMCLDCLNGILPTYPRIISSSTNNIIPSNGFLLVTIDNQRTKLMFNNQSEEGIYLKFMYHNHGFGDLSNQGVENSEIDYDFIEEGECDSLSNNDDNLKYFIPPNSIKTLFLLRLWNEDVIPKLVIDEFEYLPVVNLPIIKFMSNSYPVTTSFEEGTHALNSDGTLNENSFAVDIAMMKGTPIYPCMSGQVVEINDGNPEGQPTIGNWIVIQHENGMKSKYLHLLSRNEDFNSPENLGLDDIVSAEELRNLPQLGSDVDAATIIGYSGNSGISTGPHLHFAILKEESNLPQRFAFSHPLDPSIILYPDSRNFKGTLLRNLFGI